MPRASTRSTRPEPIFTWAFRSSKGLAGGAQLNYKTQLNQDGTLSCDCPAWIFCKLKDKHGVHMIDADGNPKKKSCPHTRLVHEEADEILSRFRNGDTLPVLHEDHGPGGTITGRFRSSESNLSNVPRADLTPKSTIRYGRYVDIDD